MANNAGTLELLARELAEAFRPLEERLGDGGADALFAEMGLRLPAGVSGHSQLATALGSAVSAAAGLAPLIAQLTAAIDADDIGQIISASANLIAKIGEVTTAAGQVASGLDNASSSFPGLSPAERAELAEFAAELPARLIDFLVVEYLHSRAPNVTAALAVLGLIDRGPVPGDPTSALQPTYVQRALHLDRLDDLFSDPVEYARDVYGWSDIGFDGLALFQKLQRYLERDFDFPVQLITPPGEGAILEAFLFSLRVDDSRSPPGLIANLRFPGAQDFERTYPLAGPWSLRVNASGSFAADVEARIAPPVDVELIPPGGTVEASLAASLTAESASDPILLIGQADGSRLEAERIALGLGFAASWSSAEGRAKGEPLATAEFRGGKLVIDLSQGDGFIQTILSGLSVESTFELGARWRPSTGLVLDGGAGIELILPSHLEIGPIALQALFFRLGFSSEAPLELGVAVAFSTSLGPLTAAVERIGVVGRFTFPEGRDGNLGPANFAVGFQPPTGLGLSLDGGGFKGGGFLSFDPDNGRYAGVLELEFQEMIAIKAIGLLTTRLPGGEQGFSLLIVVSAEFTPIQLGFGFTLNGVGGLLGLNRTMRVERLRTGIRDNTLDSILFPTDVVENANRIISDVREVFPPEADRFVFGPMGKLGWGTPSLITLSIGLVIEVPDPFRIAILGVVKALLPDEEVALLRLQVNFLGVIDFEKRLLSFDASIYDSRLLTFTLSGDMALRLSWGENPNFLLSVGGFHPAYDPPPLALPDLRRLTLQLLTGNNPRLTLETYFAVTSNSVQFGAKLELYAGAGPFNVYGFLAFDVLFQFNPFYFVAAIAAMLALRAGSSSIASISLSLTLEGPTPWKATGTAKLKLFWFLTVKVRFSTTFGEERDTRLDDVAVLPLLTAALEQDANWRAEIPSHSHQMVSLREITAPEGDVVAHPFGVLTVSQKIVPLNLRIDRFGNQEPGDADEFRIGNVQAGGLPLGTTPVKESFAPAQFFDISDSEKLSRKSFEKYDGGIRIAESEELESDHYTRREVEYELTYIDSQRNLILWPLLIKPFALAFNAWAAKGAVARSSLSHARTGKPALAPDAVRVAQEGFGVVNVADLTAVNGNAAAASEAEALVMMNRIIEENPALAGEIQVVPRFEMNE